VLYDCIIENFILKSKTKWVDGLQVVLYLYFVLKQIGNGSVVMIPVKQDFR